MAHWQGMQNRHFTTLAVCISKQTMRTYFYTFLEALGTIFTHIFTR